jgi:release factor glutamine methyltransferase
VAERNARRLDLRNLRFLQGSWFEPLSGVRFDAVASNPPYVAAADPALAALRHEPRAALVAGADGLAALAAIVSAAPGHLKPAGSLVVEHGASQGAAVRALFAAAGLSAVTTRADLAGHERVTQGTRPR